MKIIRQGDLIFRLTEIPAHVLEQEPKLDGIIQRGEATNHHHRLATLEDAEIFQHYGDIYLRVTAEAMVVHEEHAPVTLPVGEYKVSVAREFDYLQNVSRTVRD